jgi:hypothetical protein
VVDREGRGDLDQDGKADLMPESGREVRKPRCRARRRGEEGLAAPSVDATEAETGEPVAAEFGSMSSGREFLLRCCLGTGTGAGLVLATAFVLSMMLPERDFRTWVEILVLPLLLLGAGGPMLALELFPVAVRPSIVVGADGVSVRGRFIPHSRIRGVRHESAYQGAWGYGDVSEGAQDVWTVSLELADEGPLTLSTTACARLDTTNAGPEEKGDASGAHLAHTIDAARAAWVARQGGTAPADLGGDVLVRGGRTGREWLHALHRLGRDATAAYRGAAADTERLSRLLDDASARLSARAAAAVVLSTSGDTTTRKRLRIAAGALANPRLRIALEHVAEASDEDAVAEALLALEAAERQEHT